MKNVLYSGGIGCSNPLHKRQSFRQLGARFPVKSYQDRIVFGLEGSRKAGVSYATFATPQAFFYARRRQKKDN